MDTIQDQIATEILDMAKAQFDQLGYCIVDDVYSVDELEAMALFFEEFKSEGHKAFRLYHGDGVLIDEIDPGEELLRAMHPHRFSERVKEWYLHPRLAQVLASLLERPALGAQTMYYYKPPQSVGQGMHQDNFFLLAEPATCIAAWTPLDDTDEENGCLRVVPGSHHEPIICPPAPEEQTNATPRQTTIMDVLDDPEIVPIPMRRGQTLFFSGQLIHGSEPNRSSTRSRRTFIGHYVDNATQKLAEFYHPILDMTGNVVSRITIDEGGGPCEN
ncbi:MAG: phytanoyl-CoA dioxygenase family protein [Chloroflexota bacterium]